MNRHVWLSFVCAPVLWLATFCADHASAQQPDELRSLRFIPSRSTLDVIGNFAGVQQKFFAYGTFDLNTGFVPSPHAEILDVQSWLVPDSRLTFVWDTDGTLNLSGLLGTFAENDATRITFQGIDGQGAPIQLTVRQRGPLFHFAGENNPPCCNVFKYKFDALAYALPYSDFNLDGMVDQLDAEVLSGNIGTFAHATFEQGDGDGDGDVDGNDFLTWQRQVGAATPLSAFASATSAGSALNSSVVPEPATIALLYAAALALICNRDARACRGSAELAEVKRRG